MGTRISHLQASGSPSAGWSGAWRTVRGMAAAPPPPMCPSSPLRVHRGSAVSALYGQGQSAIGGTLVMPVVSGPGRG